MGQRFTLAARQTTPRRRPAPGPVGFTLLETLVVLCVIALVAGLVVPSVAGAFGARAERAALTGVRGTLAAARVEAMEAGEPVLATVRSGESISGARGVAVEVAFERAPAEILRMRSWAARGLRPTAEGGGSEVVRFAVDGRARGGPLEFVVRNVRYTINFDPVTGRPALLRPSEDLGSEGRS